MITFLLSLFFSIGVTLLIDSEAALALYVFGNSSKALIEECTMSNAQQPGVCQENGRSYRLIAGPYCQQTPMQNIVLATPLPFSFVNAVGCSWDQLQVTQKSRTKFPLTIYASSMMTKLGVDNAGVVDCRAVPSTSLCCNGNCSAAGGVLCGTICSSSLSPTITATTMATSSKCANCCNNRVELDVSGTMTCCECRMRAFGESSCLFCNDGVERTQKQSSSTPTTATTMINTDSTKPDQSTTRGVAIATNGDNTTTTTSFVVPLVAIVVSALAFISIVVLSCYVQRRFARMARFEHLNETPSVAQQRPTASSSVLKNSNYGPAPASINYDRVSPPDGQLSNRSSVVYDASLPAAAADN